MYGHMYRHISIYIHIYIYIYICIVFHLHRGYRGQLRSGIRRPAVQPSARGRFRGPAWVYKKLLGLETAYRTLRKINMKPAKGPFTDNCPLEEARF